DWCLLHYPIFVSFATFVVQNSFVNSERLEPFACSRLDRRSVVISPSEDERSGLARRPPLGEPGRQRLSRAADGQLVVLVAATGGEARERARHLEVDLQAVTIGVEEVDAALVHVVHRTLDPHRMLEQRAGSLPERLEAPH